MQPQNQPNSGFRASHLVALIVGLVALATAMGFAVVWFLFLPGLNRAKDMATGIVCANRQKSAYTGFTYYESDHGGVWMAPWDQTNGW